MLRASLFSRLTLFVAACLLVAGVCDVSQAQNQQRRRGSFGRGGGGFRIGKSTLLRAEQVQKELNITEDQKAKIDEVAEASRQQRREFFSGGFRDLSEKQRRELFAKMQKRSEESDKKLGAILTSAQTTRLNEILLQLSGVRAVASDRVSKELKISEDQKKKIQDVFTSQREMQRELYSGVNFRELSREKREELSKKSQELQQETDKAVLALLTNAQKQQFEKMKGKKFEVDRRSLFRGRGRRGGNRNRNNN